jgi:Carboxypeptidase regulatory-like domain
MRFSNQAWRVFTLLTICAASAAVGSAQFESAAALGTVTDPSNAPISAASVTLTHMRTGVSVKSTTDSSGNYLFVNQRLATCRVHVEMNGFKAEDTEPFDLAVDSRQRVNIKMVIGATSDSVTVSDAAGNP